MSDIAHMTAAEKTSVAACSASASTMMAVVVVRLASSLGGAPPAEPDRRQIGDLVVEMSTAHRGLNTSRVGVMLKISQHRSAHERMTEILMLDPPCGKTCCKDQECIHRLCWSDATFVRVPATAQQLAEALGREAQSGASGVGRDELIAALADAGFKINS
jgi:hypothetical protein